MAVPQWAIEQGRALYTLPSGEQIVRSWENVNAGLIPIEELDDEELHREKLRDKDGMFRGRGHEIVPRTLRRKIQAEIQARYVLKYQASLPDAQQVLIDIMNDDTQSAADRLRASVYLQERLVGKVPDKVEISAEIKPWEGLVGDIVHDIEEEPDEELQDDGPAALEAGGHGE